MEFKHVSVLFEECMQNLCVKPGGVYLDGTLGGGGHGSGICQRMEGKGVFIGIDRDPDALAAAAKRLEPYPVEKHLVHSTFADVKDVLNHLQIPAVDGAILDLGVSSFQLDNPDRGFSYMHDAPLDMRMNAEDSFTAFDVVNGYSEAELFRILHEYGEENWARRIAQFIVQARKQKPIDSTFALVDVIKAAIPAAARREGPHPAKRTFQAIRIEVNGELEQLRDACDRFIDCLAPGGRLCIITFHSLEDRIVKECFQKRLNPCTCPKDLPVCVCGKKPDVNKVTGKPILPTEEEINENPRSRSAKLRVIEKKTSIEK